MKFLKSEAQFIGYSQFDLKRTTIRIKDGGSDYIDITVGEGNLTWTEKKPRQYTKDRGALDEVRDADEEPLEVKIDCTWEFIRGNAADDAPSIIDALKKKNAASAWVSSDADTCRPYAVDIEVTYDPFCATADKEVILLPDFRYEQIDFDARAGTFSISGKCNVVEPTVTRTTNTA
jgi:hypothetical protein